MLILPTTDMRYSTAVLHDQIEILPQLLFLKYSKSRAVAARNAPVRKMLSDPMLCHNQPARSTVLSRPYTGVSSAWTKPCVSTASRSASTGGCNFTPQLPTHCAKVEWAMGKAKIKTGALSGVRFV
jgi:hypothetical protein